MMILNKLDLQEIVKLGYAPSVDYQTPDLICEREGWWAMVSKILNEELEGDTLGPCLLQEYFDTFEEACEAIHAVVKMDLEGN